VEAPKWGINATLAHGASDIKNAGIYVTNYQKLHRFDPSVFSGVVPDESSILKSMDGKTRAELTALFAATPFKLPCTATPSPNDLMELGNHCEFLGVMRAVEMLAMFFDHNGAETSKWSLKPHAESAFWKFVCEWAVYIRHPEDIGFKDSGYFRPEVIFHDHVIPMSADDIESTGELIPGASLSMNERRAARRQSINDRVELCAKIASEVTGPFIAWCDLNKEGDAIAESIPGAVQVTGSDSDDFKESAMRDFSNGATRVLVSKPKICGFGMNWQHCGDMAFVGLSDSYEAMYQAISRCARFGRTEPVNVHIITHAREGVVLENIRRKEQQAKQMADAMVEHMREIQTDKVKGQMREIMEYKTDVAKGDKWTYHLGDSCEVIKSVPTGSVDYQIFSPPFASLYTYSNSPRDMGNSKNHSEFYKHFGFLVGEMLRVSRPGRLLSFHCMNLPTSKERDGVIGISDFRGELIRIFCESGWIYHSEVVIWKDPVTAMQRTKAIGLLHKTIRKDSSMSRQGIPDYLVTMRAKGQNDKPIAHTSEEFPVHVWQRYASPVWMDINPTDTLQKESAKENDNERHICPLQLEVIRRALELWTAPNDLVASWFGGIGSEGYESIRMGRRFLGCELKESYWRCGVTNLSNAVESTDMDLFSADI
jgi:hypothetical protein